jgi:hypothetical protein
MVELLHHLVVVEHVAGDRRRGGAIWSPEISSRPPLMA